MSIFIENEDYPSDVHDIQKTISVDSGLQELITFGDAVLFLYVEKLLSTLKEAVGPSPMAFFIEIYKKMGRVSNHYVDL